MLKIRPKESGEVRCIYCHGVEDTRNTGLELVECNGCKATMHIQCRHDAEQCATIGCNYRVPGAVKQFYADRDKVIDWCELLASESRSPLSRCEQCNERGHTYAMFHLGVPVGQLCMGCIRNGYPEIRYRDALRKGEPSGLAAYGLSSEDVIAIGLVAAVVLLVGAIIGVMIWLHGV